MSEKVRLIEVKENILDDNTVVSAGLREELKQKKTFLMNLMASPGAGKTTTLLSTLGRLKEDLRIGVLEADIDSVVDAEKIADSGIDAVQLRTGGFCHMDATMVKEGLDAIGYEAYDLIVLENVGNLVCPAEFDTGSLLNAMILSIPEGDDKPLKYPLMFSVCNVILVNKIDTIDLFDFDMDAFRERVLKINPDVKIFEISAKTGQGVDEWAAWLKASVKEITG